jgi:hypothetical protein
MENELFEKITGEESFGWNGADLLDAEFSEPEWLVEGLIPSTGFVILGGPPKRGKSWLMLELALAVCSNGYFLNRKVKEGKVLYLAIEDNPRRLKDRMRKQGWTREAAANLRVVFADTFRERYGGKDGPSLLAAEIATGGYTLVIIDTVSRAFSIRDWNDQALVVAALSPIQEATMQADVCVIGADHHNKLGSIDPILALIGSVSKSGVADVIVGLFKEQGRPGARLAVTGRDVEEQELTLIFDGVSGCWQVTKPQDGLTELQRETIAVIERFQGGATLIEIANATGRNKGTVSKELTLLMERGFIRKDGTRWVV